MGEQKIYEFLDGDLAAIRILNDLTIYHARDFHSFLQMVAEENRPLKVEIVEDCDLDTSVLQLLLAFARDYSRKAPLTISVASPILRENLRFLEFERYVMIEEKA